MQVDNNWYWNQHPQQNFIAMLKHTILHPQLEVNEVTSFHEIPKIVYNRAQKRKPISRHPICLTDYDYD